MLTPSNLSLQDWLIYIDQVNFSQIELGLERTTKVATKLNLTHNIAPQIVTVAGTNGKGSTCAYLGAILQECGLQVGIYSSPHLLRFNERIQINAKCATDADICNAFAIIERHRGDIPLTYFEFSTLAALYLFKQAQVDVAILEVGLGGALDAVNIVDPNLGIITSIGMEHTQWLGNSLDAIATEKLGILRPNIPCIYGEHNPPHPVFVTTKNLNNPLYVLDRDFSVLKNAESWSFNSSFLNVKDIPNANLLTSNAACAICAASLLEANVTPQAIKQGLGAVKIRGRFEQQELALKNKTVTVIYDVAHNPPAAKFLVDGLQLKIKDLAQRKIYAVFSALADKDVPNILQPLAPLITNWAVAKLDCERSLSCADLCQSLQNAQVKFSIHNSIVDAFLWQLECAPSNSIILVFGSFHVLNEVMSHKHDINKFLSQLQT